MIILTGLLERITYHNEENHYMIGRLRPDESKNLVTVVGYMAGVNPGETLKINGKWETHPKYGQQFKVDSLEVTLPAAVEGIEKYLKSGIIKGIGRKMADRLVRHFEEKTLNIIEKHPGRLIEVQGIGPKMAARITDAWKSHHAIRELVGFLRKFNINVVYSSKILKQYGKDAVTIISDSPYRLVRDIPDIGFFAADTIAKNLGFSKDDPERIKACIEYQIGQFVGDGHTYMPKTLLSDRLEKRFQIEPDAAEKALDTLIEAGAVTVEPFKNEPTATGVYPTYLYEAEIGISKRIKALLSIPVWQPSMKQDHIISELLKRIAIKPSSEQLDILEGILSHRVAVITGGPGTGKTTLIRSITVIYQSLGKKILLAAPTGRAARRLAEVTQRKAETIHKLLKCNVVTGIFDKNRDDPLNADAVIIDEASMVDTVLMFHLLNAVPLSAVLILVGDIFQLPSIGPGNVLSDMIRSKSIQSFELKKIFRQAHESPIVINAHKVRRGEMPELKHYESPKERSEFFFIEQSHPESVVEKIIELCTKTLPNQLALTHINEVQVITPMHKGAVGTLNLNQVLQKVMNPDTKTVRISNSRFKLKDKVMHLKNNYQKEVFNGDIGAIHAIDNEQQQISVNYDDRIVYYDFEELDELSLAYAISVHKSQGSEYPAVIIPLMTQHFALLQRNLLYTAITRGKNLVIIIGTRKALSIALRNNKPTQRLSNLTHRLNA